MINERPSPCYTCGIVFHVDIMQRVDMDGDGYRLVDLCTACLGRVNDQLKEIDWSHEALCDTCGNFDPVFNLDGAKNTCYEDMERQIIEELHSEIFQFRAVIGLDNPFITEIAARQ